MEPVHSSPLVENFFDNAANAPSTIHILRESRAVIELGQFFQSLGHTKALPTGDGHPVIVIPGFLTNDRYTTPLRWFLKRQGYNAQPWQLGTNTSFKLRQIQNLQKLIHRTAIDTGKKVSLVGWSLGGVYARYISHTMPEYIRQIITLGTPFAKTMSAGVTKTLYEMLNRQKVKDHHPDIIHRIAKPVPVPATSIYSKLDAVVAWECSVCPTPNHNHEHVEIQSSHCGLTHNPAALYTIADRLALPENRWSPFDEHELKTFMSFVTTTQIPKVSELKQSNMNAWREALLSMQEIYTELKQPAAQNSLS